MRRIGKIGIYCMAYWINVIMGTSPNNKNKKGAKRCLMSTCFWGFFFLIFCNSMFLLKTFYYILFCSSLALINFNWLIYFIPFCTKLSLSQYKAISNYVFRFSFFILNSLIEQQQPKKTHNELFHSSSF